MGLVVGALIVRGDHLFAAQRAYPPEFAGQWELPGGKVEPGEDPYDALRREIREELGIDIVIQQELLPDDGDTWPILRGHRMRVWVCVPRGEPCLGADHLEIRWLEPDALWSVRWLEPDVPIIEAWLRNPR
ncbi:MAG: NUDIX domain-containing protein [Ruaniaceae bacterium]|nr:NUDIX domain-containing protein [Ruaniaceae bacterium]